MRQYAKREVVLTACGFGGALLFYLFAIHLPLQRACEAARAGAEAAQRVLATVPQRIAELERLRAELHDAEDYVNSAESVVPFGYEPWAVQQVAQLGCETHVHVEKIEPLPPETHRTYTVESFEVDLEGPFLGVAEFLAKLESGERLCRIRSLQLSRKTGRGAEGVQCSVRFDVFSRRTGKPDCEENGSNSQFAAADK